MNGRFFPQFIRDHFNLCFAAADPRTNGQLLFVMDNDPSQNSGPACQAMEGVEHDRECVSCVEILAGWWSQVM